MSAPWSILFGTPGVHSFWSERGVFFQRHDQWPSGGSAAAVSCASASLGTVVFDTNFNGM